MDFSEAKERARELVGKMTVDEKISQLLYTSEAVERLGIHEYNWWNEAAHGVARAGNATVFPQAIGLAASFDPELIGEIGRAVADEARAKYNKSVELGDRGIYKGLTFWAPNINIFRDGRWGRGQETFGEDPFLTAALAVSYIKGLQGDGDFIKAAACAKHFAVHSGPEKLRHGFNAEASRKDMWETYLPAFEKCVEAGVAGVMGAYNRTNGQPCCANDYLMTEVLFGKWGFEGYFVSDCGAVADIYSGHHYTESLEEAAALALKKSCCLNCGKAYSSLTDAYEHDLVDEEDITAAAEKLFAVRFMLGEFEEKRPFADIPYSVVGCEKHRELNLEAARRSLVLLENRDGFLPVGGRYKRIAVIGPNSDSVSVLEGNYNGTSSEYLTVSEGMRRVFDGAKITVERGSPLVGGRGDWSPDLTGPALAAASESGLAVLCLGLDPHIEGEEMPISQDGFDGGDRTAFSLPAPQRELAEKVCEICPDTVVLTFGGGPVDVGDRIRSMAKAHVHCFYPGALGGLAVAQLLHGDFCPSGKLPVTFPRADSALPDICDYSMEGRTYRFMREKPLYPFGYGLSYTTVEVTEPIVAGQSADRVTLCVKAANTGNYGTTATVQIYARYGDSRTETPVCQLCATKAVRLDAGQTADVTLEVDRYWLKAVLESGERTDPDGEIRFFAGLPDFSSREP